MIICVDKAEGMVYNEVDGHPKRPLGDVCGSKGWRLPTGGVRWCQVVQAGCKVGAGKVT
jgi:hypothetical protein